MQRLEIKTSVTVDEAGMVAGIAWPFGTPDRVGDVITKGAFAGAPTTIPMLAFHDPDDPVGTWSEVRETDRGLEVKGRLLVEDLARAREVRALVKAGAVGGLSIGFFPKSTKPRPGGGRTIDRLELLEISLVTIPSHPGARVTTAKDATAALRISEAIKRAAAAFR